MTFLSPIWLWLAVPWAALAVWLLRGRGRDTSVPFVALWQDVTHASRIHRRWRLPPAAVLLLLASMLLGILAAARPAIAGRDDDAEPITLIWDRGIDMAGRHADIADDLSAALATATAHPRRLRLIPVPGGQPIPTDTRQWLDQARNLSDTAINTDAMLRAQIAAALRETDQPVIVVTDRQPPIADPRLIVVTPPNPPHNVRIEHFAFRDDPKPQAMVRVRNDSRHARADLRITAGQRIVDERSIDLPPPGEARSYFIDIAQAPDVISAELVVDDLAGIDNRAWLTRQSRWPRVVTTSPMPPAVQRMSDIYTAQRPADDRSPTLIVSRQPMADGIAGIIVAPAQQPAPSQGAIRLSAHPIFDEVTFAALQPLRISAQPPPEGFTVVARIDDAPLLAVRDAPARQVWIGFDSPSFAMTPGFVVLWARMLEWAGGEAELYGARHGASIGGSWQRIEPGALPADVQPGWLAGLYRDRVGRLMAVNPPPPDRSAGAAPAPAGDARDSRQSLTSLAALPATAKPVGNWLTGAAVVMGLAAAVCWLPAGLTRPYGRRTVPS